MKVCHTSVIFTFQKTLIFQLQVTLELSQFQEILSIYTDFLFLFAEYPSLFKFLKNEPNSLQGKNALFKNNFITQDPARDGSNWWNYCRNNPMKYTDPDGRLMRLADGTLKVERTGNIVTFDVVSNTGTKKVSYEQVYLFTNKNTKVMAFENMSYTPLWQDSTGETIADGKYSFDLNVSDSTSKALNKKIGYNPTEAINTILNDEYEPCSKESASIGVNKMKNGFLSVKKILKEKSFYLLTNYFASSSEKFNPIPITKENEKEFSFYKESE